MSYRISCEQIDKENTVLRLNSQDVEIEVIELRGQLETLTEVRGRTFCRYCPNGSVCC